MALLNLTPSQNCYALIRSCEAFESKPYSDLAGIPTIGYGTTVYPNGQNVKLSDPECTAEQAEQYLEHDLQAAARAVNLVKVPLNQNQFDALCSFTYNEGVGAFKRSTLLKLLNTGDYLGASAELLKWCYSGKNMIFGLLVRRRKEQKLFLS